MGLAAVAYLQSRVALRINGSSSDVGRDSILEVQAVFEDRWEFL